VAAAACSTPHGSFWWTDHGSGLPVVTPHADEHAFAHWKQVQQQWKSCSPAQLPRLVSTWKPHELHGREFPKFLLQGGPFKPAFVTLGDIMWILGQ